MIVFRQESYEIVGAAFEVYNDLGPGFLEAVYQEALEIELKDRGIPFEREKLIHIYYKGVPIKTLYQADFVCYDNLIVELKTVDQILDIHRAQIIHYLKATNIKKGILINFKSNSLQYERFANDY